MAEVVRGNLSAIFRLKNRKKLTLIMLIAVLLFAAGIFAYQKWVSAKNTGAFMQVLTVKRGDVTETVASSGTVQASKRVSLSLGTQADITAIHVQVGDQVKAGQVLAVLDDSSAQIQLKAAEANLSSALAKLAEAKKPKTASEMRALEANVNQAKAVLDSARNSYDTQKAQNDLEKAKMNLQNAQNTYNSQKALYDEGGISKSEYDQAKQNLDQAKIEYDNAVLQANQSQGQSKSSLEQAQSAYESAVSALQDAKDGPDATAVQSAQASVEQAEAQLQEQKMALEKLTVKAPMDGVIVAINGNLGEPPSQPFIVMDNSNSGNLEVLAQISESDIGKVKVGQTATFTSNSYPDKEFNGKVTLIYPEATIESGVTTYKVLLSVDNKEGLLKTGMSTNVSIEVGTHKNVLYVPPAALKSQNGKDGVYLAAANEGTAGSRQGNKGETGETRQGTGRGGSTNLPFRFQEVKIGYFSTDRVEITEGLREGDRVVLTMDTSRSTSSSSGRQSGPGGFPGMGGMGVPGGGWGGGGQRVISR
ncbi:efflux RND transporter periplasmic adaptor subunit [Brevibacillus massiliensis]|uniref:efflux RND transporter periplasmic adaptor subunit n=1 Tax=Brevibacillus massiliensis TaxID=1118054 RepID=UPI00031284EA|nr:efflux RND transporter periplasmic adaptor subunit [Brevibacillus massiliensis]